MASPVIEKKSGDKARGTNETIKETLESIVIAFILAFVFRAYVVEAFQIPTGSMAPTLLGAHARVTCSQCGYRFEADWPANVSSADGTDVPVPLRDDAWAVCPMCRFANRIASGAIANPGDRILVHKYIYNVSEPRRWDVVVFKSPPSPDTNFIKRLVGLPNEELQIIEGNVYTRQLDARGTLVNDWHIERKSVRPDVQRAVWQPVYHSDFIPLDGGRPGNPMKVGDRDLEHAWRVPWKAQTLSDRWSLDGSRAYRFSPQSVGTGYEDTEGVIAFDFAQQRYGATNDSQRSGEITLFPYDQFRRGMSANSPDEAPVEDVRVAAAVQALGPGLAVRLQTTARWAKLDGGQRVTIAGRIEKDGTATLTATGRDGKEEILERGSVEPFLPGRAHEVELWYVDQEASLWVDGRPVVRAAFAEDFQYLVDRVPLPNRSTPEIRIGVSGAPAVLERVEVDRDIYYTADFYRGPQSGQPGLGVLAKAVDNGHVRHVGQPARLQADQFFCMGDNSPLSSDSRMWSTVNDWVRKLMLKNSPPDNPRQVGIVPRELMMGRAFFVYWPAMYGLAEQRATFIPNFGDMRFIH